MLFSKINKVIFDAENFKIKRERKQRKQPQRYGSNVTTYDLALVQFFQF